jgi:hypothetical protein
MKPQQSVGVVGPTDVLLVEKTAGLSAGTLKNAAREVGVFLAEQSLGMVCVPVKGVPLWALEAYKQAGGNNSLALWPGRSEPLENGKETKPGNPELADRRRDDLAWGEGPFELAKSSDCLVSLGLSCGTMVEMIATKWMKGCPVLLVRSLMTGIPDEIAAELNLRYSASVESLKQDVLALLRQKN